MRSPITTTYLYRTSSRRSGSGSTQVRTNVIMIAIISNYPSSAPSPLYMAKISPPEVRGSLMALEQFGGVMGVVIGFWLGYFTRDLPGSISWHIPLGRYPSHTGHCPHHSMCILACFATFVSPTRET